MENFMTISGIVYLTTTQLGVSGWGGDRGFQNWMKNVMNLRYNYIYISTTKPRRYTNLAARSEQSP
jgi:hypothetical protein